MNANNLLTTAEVAQALRTTEQTIRNWIDHGRVEATRVGRRYLIPRGELARLQGDAAPPPGETPWDHTQPPVPLRRADDSTAAGWVE